MRPHRRLALLALAAAASLPFPALSQGAFQLGVAPHTSARVIVEMYQPLRMHLERALNAPVEIVTAPDFTEFARRAVNQQYDLAVTTGHQARLLQTDAGYLPIITYAADFKAVALVPASSPAAAPDALRGGRALGLSPTSLVTLWGQHWLKRNNLGDMPMQFISASDSLARLLVAGRADVGFTSLANYQQLAPDIRAQLRILASSDPMAGRVYVLNKRRAGTLSRIETALEGFAASGEGKAYLQAYKLEGYRKLRPKELEAMDPYAAEVREQLRAKGP